MEEEKMSVFKSYLRRLLQDLIDVNEATPDTEENREAKEMLEKLIDDTQKGIEDS